VRPQSPDALNTLPSLVVADSNRASQHPLCAFWSWTSNGRGSGEPESPKGGWSPLPFTLIFAFPASPGFSVMDRSPSGASDRFAYLKPPDVALQPDPAGARAARMSPGVALRQPRRLLQHYDRDVGLAWRDIAVSDEVPWVAYSRRLTAADDLYDLGCALRDGGPLWVLSMRTPFAPS
jgi:hypothetical protein